MDTKLLKEAIKRELPNLLRDDPAFRTYVLELTRQEYADRAQTQDRFYEILAELRRDREAQTRKWEEQDRKWKEQNQRWEEQNRKWDEQNQRWEEQYRKWDQQNQRWEEQNPKWDQQNQRWEEQYRKWDQQNQRLEEQNRKWDQQNQRWEEQNRKWDQQNQRWEEQNRKWDQQNQRWEEQNRKWDTRQTQIQEQFQRVHEEIMAQAQKFDRSIGALGSRWGMQSEAAFRNALAGILEKNFDVQVINVTEYDDEGTVFGRPEQVELDVIIKNGLLLICELKSSIDKAGMYIFERKARFYEQRHNRKAQRLIVISPMIDARALKVADRFGIETYSDSLDVESL